MTLPHERTRAVLETRKFLLALMDPKQTPRVPRELRLKARDLLRHYPIFTADGATVQGYW